MMRSKISAIATGDPKLNQAQARAARPEPVVHEVPQCPPTVHCHQFPAGSICPPAMETVDFGGKKKLVQTSGFFFTGMNGNWTIESMNLIIEYAHFSPWNLKHWISPTRMRCTPSPNKAIKSGKDIARKVEDLLLELYKTSLFTG